MAVEDPGTLAPLCEMYPVKRSTSCEIRRGSVMCESGFGLPSDGAERHAHRAGVSLGWRVLADKRHNRGIMKRPDLPLGAAPGRLGIEDLRGGEGKKDVDTRCER